MSKAKKTADKPAKKKTRVNQPAPDKVPAEVSTEIRDDTPIEYGKTTKKFIVAADLGG